MHLAVVSSPLPPVMIAHVPRRVRTTDALLMKRLTAWEREVNLILDGW